MTLEIRPNNRASSVPLRRMGIWWHFSACKNRRDRVREMMHMQKQSRSVWYLRTRSKMTAAQGANAETIYMFNGEVQTGV